MFVKEIIKELNEFFSIQERDIEIHRKIEQLYGLINSYSKKATLEEVLDDTLKQLNHNSQEYNELYKKHIEGENFTESAPMLIYRDLNIAVLALMKEQELSFDELAERLPYNSKKLENVLKTQEYYEDTHAVYCVLCDHFDLSKQQYSRFTKVDIFPESPHQVLKQFPNHV